MHTSKTSECTNQTSHALPPEHDRSPMTDRGACREAPGARTKCIERPARVKGTRCGPKVEMSCFLQSRDVGFDRSGTWERSDHKGAPAVRIRCFVAQRDLRVGEARGIARALLRGDPGEGAVKMLVRDDDTGHEHGLVPSLPPVGEHATVAADRDGAVGGFADKGDGPAEAAVLDGVLEEVEPALVVHGERGRDAAGVLEGEDLGRSSSGSKARCASCATRGGMAKRRLWSAMKIGRNGSASAGLEIPRRRSSLTSRSCSVPLARSTRPFAWGLLAQILSMLRSRNARPNCRARRRPGRGHGPGRERYCAGRCRTPSACRGARGSAGWRGNSRTWTRRRRSRVPSCTRRACGPHCVWTPRPAPVVEPPRPRERHARGSLFACGKRQYKPERPTSGNMSTRRCKNPAEVSYLRHHRRRRRADVRRNVAPDRVRSAVRLARVTPPGHATLLCMRFPTCRVKRTA